VPRRSRSTADRRHVGRVVSVHLPRPQGGRRRTDRLTDLGHGHHDRADDGHAAVRASAAFEEGLAAAPSHSGLHYNLACTRALNNEPDAAFEHLAIAIDGYPGFAELARKDGDFDSIRNDPRFPA